VERRSWNGEGSCREEEELRMSDTAGRDQNSGRCRLLHTGTRGFCLSYQSFSLKRGTTNEEEVGSIRSRAVENRLRYPTDHPEQLG